MWQKNALKEGNGALHILKGVACKQTTHNIEEGTPDTVKGNDQETVGGIYTPSSVVTDPCTCSYTSDAKMLIFIFRLAH